MKEILYRIVNGNLNEIKGLSISGNIPLSEDIVNEMLQNYLDTLGASQPGAADSADFHKVFRSLDERSIYISLSDNTANLEIDIGKY